MGIERRPGVECRLEAERRLGAGDTAPVGATGPQPAPSAPKSEPSGRAGRTAGRDAPERLAPPPWRPTLRASNPPVNPHTPYLGGFR
ncbi:hypothetical protein FAGKG844_420015 [Frankia sp. AgKG'84/4]